MGWVHEQALTHAEQFGIQVMASKQHSCLADAAVEEHRRWVYEQARAEQFGIQVEILCSNDCHGRNCNML